MFEWTHKKETVWYVYFWTCTHGHIVGATTIFLIRTPLIPDGLFSSIDFRIVWMFCTSCSSVKSSFHTATWIFHVLSNLYSTLHFFNSSIVLEIFGVTVQAFGLGISHFGHRIFATFARSLIWSGVATSTSNSISHFCTASTIEVFPTMSAHAWVASSLLSSATNAATVTLFPVPWGKMTVALSIWSLYFGFAVVLTCSSNDHTNELVDTSFARATASSNGYFFSGWTFAFAATNFFPLFGITNNNIVKAVISMISSPAKGTIILLQFTNSLPYR